MIPDDRGPELHALGEALGGQPAPCMTTFADTWFDQPAEASVLCLSDCHAVAECAALALALRPKHGVWAGRDYSTKPITQNGRPR